MPGMYTHKLKWWAYVALKCVAMYRNFTGARRGDRILAFVFVHGFKPL